MIKKIKQWLTSILQAYRNSGMYVIADARDNSITFSKRLFKHMHVFEKDEANAYVFRLCNACVEEGSNLSGDIYAFIINPPFQQETQLGAIQYNAKHKCIGFESLCPTVNRIFYDYGIPADKPVVKLDIRPVCGDSVNNPYYIILPPHDNTTR